MKRKLILTILITLIAQCNYIMADDIDNMEIKSPDIKEAVKESRKEKNKNVFKKVFIDSETENITKNNEKKSEEIKEKTQQKIEQEPVIEAFGPPEKNEKLTATIQKVPILTLDDCIKMALENNPTIRSSIANSKVYKTKIGQAWANYFPKIGAGISYSKNKMLPLYFKPAVATYNSWAMPSVDAEWMIFDFGKTKVQADAAKITHEATEETLQETINTTIYNVKDAFYSLLFTLQQEQVWQTSVEQYEISLEQAKAYYSIGTKPKIDVYTAEYNLSNAKLGHIKAINDISIAYAQLNNAMGLPEYANYELAEELTLKKYNLNLEHLLKDAQEIRPELLAAEKKAKASKKLVSATKIAFLPDLTLSANYTQGGLTAGSGEYGYGIGGNFAYRSTNFMLLKKQVDEAKAVEERETAEYEVTRQKVYLDVKQAYIKVKNAKENVPVSKNAMIQAEEQFNLARGRYKVGLGDVIELKDAETTYRNAQLNYYNALLNYNISVANLERVVGTPIQAVEEVDL